ncbi:MAG: phosphotransferase [Armatimonadetes bacterium]|nr:phosphotransferase [Armatimonadota bacterium]
MSRPPDTPPPPWVWSWACALEGAQPAACTRVPSNDVNAVYRLDFGDRRLFLKIGPRLRPEHDRLRWLEGRMPAPRPLGFMAGGDADALLTSAVEGQGLASLSATLPPPVIITRLAAALRGLHATPTAGWPFGGDGPVLVHGDACLPNFLYVGDRLSGYIDVGDMALGEPEVDLAAAVWSLQYNLGPGRGLAFLREYGMADADEDDVERLRLRYEQQ